MNASWSLDVHNHDKAGDQCYIQQSTSVGQFNPSTGNIADNTDDDWLTSTYRAGNIKYLSPPPP